MQLSQTAVPNRWEAGENPEGSQTTTDLDFYVLGPMEVRRGEQPLAVGGPKPRTLLANLVLHHGNAVSTEALIDALWGAVPPRTAAKTLQKYVSDLRKEVGERLVTHRDGYALEVSCAAVDACRFEDSIDGSVGVAPTSVIELLTGALSLWRGAPYPELVDTADGLAEATRLGERRLEAEGALIEARLNLGQESQVVGWLEELVSLHPLREHFWRQLMLALYRSGRQADALRAYQRLRGHLESLGIEPEPAVRDLEDRILLQDPTLLGPTAPPTGRLHNLPEPLTSFIGRVDELDQLGALLGDVRLVTLIGPGGSGKTRLSVEACRNQIDHMPHGVWFVDFAPLTSPDDMSKAVADPLNVSGHADRQIIDVLLDYVAGRELLLLLDNCEHLVAEAAALADQLLRVGPGVRILATSREPLGVEGELTFEVPTLPVPTTDAYDQVRASEAAQLFVDRSRRVNPNFELDEANAAAVADISRRLDGIPLAIELAAARVRTFTPQEIAALLDNRFAVLASPVRGSPARHQTLRAAVDWSYDALGAQEEILFSRLAVFRGGFDLEAAGRVCAAPPLSRRSLVTLVAELVDKSMVVIDPPREDTSRYRLLETLRAYGRERLDPAEQSALRDAHAAYYCNLAERAAPQLRGPDQQRWIRRITLDYENLRRALRWAFSHHPETAIRLSIALGDYWDAVGPRTEALEWLGRAVELADARLPGYYISARLAASDLFVSTDLSHSTRYADEALTQARTVGDEWSEAAALRALGWANALQDDYDTAVDLGIEGLEIWRELGDLWQTSWSLERLGQSDYTHPGRVIAWFEESLAGFREVGDTRRAGMVLYKMAEAGARAGLPLETTERWVEESLAIFEQMGSVHDSAHALLELGKIMRRRGHPKRAVAVLETGLERMRMVGDQRCTTRTSVALGIALIQAGDRRSAWQRLRTSLGMARVVDERQVARVALAGMGQICAFEGLHEEAVVLTAAAERLSGDLGVAPSDAALARRGRRVDAMRSALGPAEFDAAWNVGSSFALDEAVGFALEIPGPSAEG